MEDVRNAVIQCDGLLDAVGDSMEMLFFAFGVACEEQSLDAIEVLVNELHFKEKMRVAACSVVEIEHYDELSALWKVDDELFVMQALECIGSLSADTFFKACEIRGVEGAVLILGGGYFVFDADSRECYERLFKLEDMELIEFLLTYDMKPVFCEFFKGSMQAESLELLDLFERLDLEWKRHAVDLINYCVTRGLFTDGVAWVLTRVGRLPDSDICSFLKTSLTESNIEVFRLIVDLYGIDPSSWGEDYDYAQACCSDFGSFSKGMQQVLKMGCEVISMGVGELDLVSCSATYKQLKLVWDLGGFRTCEDLSKESFIANCSFDAFRFVDKYVVPLGDPCDIFVSDDIRFRSYDELCNFVHCYSISREDVIRLIRVVVERRDIDSLVFVSRLFATMG